MSKSPRIENNDVHTANGETECNLMDRSTCDVVERSIEGTNSGNPTSHPNVGLSGPEIVFGDPSIVPVGDQIRYALERDPR